MASAKLHQGRKNNITHHANTPPRRRCIKLRAVPNRSARARAKRSRHGPATAAPTRIRQPPTKTRRNAANAEPPQLLEVNEQSSLDTHTAHHTGALVSDAMDPNEPPIRRQRRLRSRSSPHHSSIIIRVREETFPLGRMPGNFLARRDVVPRAVRGAARR